LKKLNGVSDNLFFVLWCGFFVYMISIEAAQGHWLFATWSTLILSIGVTSLISGKIRARTIKKFATTHSFTYLGGLLPNGLILYFTSFSNRHCSTNNCLQGSLRGISLAVFDLAHRKGKGSVSQTIVAFPRQGSSAFPETPIDAVGCYEFEAAGDWIIAWIPRRVVKVEELEDWCIELHTLASDLLAEARGESEARPRLFRWLA
jgi:hypothetical protein